MRDPSIRLALVLGALSAVGPFAIDMYLPALPSVVEDLHTSQDSVMLTLAVFLLTFGLAQLIYGPLSDVVGRKVPMVIGAGLFAGAAIGAAWAPSIEWLIATRALQGLGAAALVVVPRAVIRDVATGPVATRMMAGMLLVMSISPMLAPFTGSIVLAWGGWREIFMVLAAASLASLTLILFAVPETLPPARRQPVRFASIRLGVVRLLRDMHFLGLTFVGAFGFARLLVFVAAASFVYVQQYGMGPTGFSLAFAVNAIGFFAASKIAGRVTARLGMNRTLWMAISAFALTSIMLAALVGAGSDALPIVMGGLLLAFACLGLLVPTAIVMSLDPHPEIAGLAASIGGAAHLLMGGLVIALMSSLMGTSALSMVGTIAVCASLGWLTAVATLTRPRLGRQDAPDRPGTNSSL